MTREEFIRTLESSIDNAGLTDTSFRSFIRSSLPLVEGSNYFSENEPDITVLYHGVKTVETVHKILEEGFSPDTYYFMDMQDALSFGGNHIFRVAFLESDLPKHWQVRCFESIPPHRIYNVNTYAPIEVKSFDHQSPLKEVVDALLSNRIHAIDNYAFNDTWDDQL